MSGEPFSGSTILLASISGALVVVAGGGYALLFALGRLTHKRYLTGIGYGCYAVLAVAVLVLVDSLAIDGAWLALVLLMLSGYLIAPHGIWHLCVATHADATYPKGEKNE